MDGRTGKQGLSTAEASLRRADVGPNEIERRAPLSPVRLLASQFASPLVLVLLGAVGVSAALGEQLDAIAICVIVAVNAGVGFGQEYRAERSMAALGNLTARRATVVRDGQAVHIPSREVVPGDILVLEPGDVVAADARLVDAHHLTAVESILTGESMPASKTVAGVDPDTPLAERHGEVFMGTQIATGAGRAQVVGTGASTEMGRIATMLHEQQGGSTPLQERMGVLGQLIVIVCLGLVGLVAVLGWWSGMGWLEILMTSVTLAVAAIPEGLPAIVTIALAVGVNRMAARNVLVRRLASVETLGCATVICTDKTGTLTRGVMEVQEVWGGERSSVLETAAAACDPELSADDKAGDPTELAILRGAPSDSAVLATRAESIEPFDPATRRMIVRRTDGVTYVKGAVEVIAEMSRHCPAGLDAAHDRLAKRGLRVLATASGEPGSLEFVGLIGIADAPREDAIAAVAEARRAGVRVVMITGDHPDTAHAIAEQMGIVRPGEDPAKLVYARASAKDKLAIVRELRERGEVVAMTGDGVNDAPAISEADIGIAMGETATEVTREASDMILTKDNLGGIVDAIREGRVIFENIRKTVVYLLGGNSAELLFVIASVAMGLPMPLIPLQLLWLNLLGEPLPGIALALDPPSGDTLAQAPRARSEPILAAAQWREIVGVAVLHAALVLALYVVALGAFDLAIARTVSFSALVFGIIFRAFAGRSATKILWELGASTNTPLVLVVAASVGLQLGIVYFPPAQRLFELAPLSAPLLGIAFVVGLVPVTVLELAKLWRRTASRS